MTAELPPPRRALSLFVVEGTWGGAWAHAHSAFRLYLDNCGVEVYPRTEWWSLDVGGLPSLTAARKHSDWRIGGEFLGDALARVAYEDRNVLAHSYGGNVGLYAAAGTRDPDERDGCFGFDGVPIRRLITVATPPRGDMDAVADRAKARIGYWLHVTDTRGDWMQRLGQVFDGRFSFTPRKLQLKADQNIGIPKINHSKLFTDADKFPLWEDLGILQFLRATDGEISARDVSAL